MNKTNVGNRGVGLMELGPASRAFTIQTFNLLPSFVASYCGPIIYNMHMLLLHLIYQYF